MVLNYILFRFPGIPGVSAAFQTRAACLPPDLTSTRNGGNISLELDALDADEAVTAATRRTLVRDLGLEAFAETRQVHGVRTLFAPRAQAPDTPPTEEADGMAASRGAGQTHLGLMVKTADCQPILLAHKAGGHILALHAGWKGNRKYFPQIAVEEFCLHYKLKAADLSAVRGPSLGPSAAQFTRFDTEWGAAFEPWFDRETQTMDLWALAKDQLIEAGLKARNIYSLDLCTWSLPDFFSFRRDSHCGRQASLIWME